jgi:hypothetical protein
VILLIFAGVILIAIFQDSQVLRRLEDTAYARGVIKFLISLAAIGLAFMFVHQALTGGNTSEAGFQRGREVLSGLMGVLGTIVGFYFGSDDKGGGAHCKVTLCVTNGGDFNLGIEMNRIPAKAPMRFVAAQLAGRLQRN